MRNAPEKGRGETLNVLADKTKFTTTPSKVKQAIVRAALDGRILFAQAEHLIRVLGLQEV